MPSTRKCRPPHGLADLPAGRQAERLKCGARVGGLSITLAVILGSLAGASPAPVLNVPFFPDKTDQCGPATLAAVLTFWGKPIEPSKLREEMYLAKLHGTLPMDLMLTAKQHGLQTEMVRGSLETLRTEVEAGRPVIAMLNLGLSSVPVNHFVVVTGLDPTRQAVRAHSAGKANQSIPYKKFMRAWEKTDYWALLTHNP